MPGRPRRPRCRCSMPRWARPIASGRGRPTRATQMPKQLREMLTDLRAEIGHSTNVAHGINDRDTLLYYLNRTQIDLYNDYNWPELIIDRDIPVADGQRYYPYPTDLAFDDVTNIWVLINTVYNELGYGI